VTDPDARQIEAIEAAGRAVNWFSWSIIISIAATASRDPPTFAGASPRAFRRIMNTAIAVSNVRAAAREEKHVVLN